MHHHIRVKALAQGQLNRVGDVMRLPKGERGGEGDVQVKEAPVTAPSPPQVVQVNNVRATRLNDPHRLLFVFFREVMVEQLIHCLAHQTKASTRDQHRKANG